MDTIIRLMADGLIVVIALAAVGILLVKVTKAQRYDTYTRIFMAGITSYVLAKFIGSLWQPEQLRPFEKLGLDPGAAYLNNPGFPSDHALLAFFLVFAVWFATRSRILTIVLAALAIVMCAGRVVALVHTPLDIAGSLIIAAIGAVWYIANGKNTVQPHVAKRAKK